MTLPELSPEAKRAALKKAQEMRSKRARVREDLKQGRLTLEEVLDSADDAVISRIREPYLLKSLPRIGKVRCRKVMEDIGIHESRRVQGLGARQREALLSKLAK